MNIFFETVSWLATIALTLASVPQVILIFKKKSVEGISWLTYGFLLFGLGVLFIRSLFTIYDLIIQLNYALGLFAILTVNLQFVYYRFFKKEAWALYIT